MSNRTDCIGRRAHVVAALLFVLASSQILAESLPGVANANRARINYMLNCQGCHGAGAEGSIAAAVPRMRDYVGNFLHVPGGREFLVQVPGSANASIDDAALAELLNWMLHEISSEQLPDEFSPYTATEIENLRYDPQEDVAGTRARLVEAIEQVGLGREQH